ncbi:hypothetical protein PENTCL1PPCAC_1104, partial [Pristionchus entomophagus]
AVMALAVQSRLKQMMLYRLEEQLRVISQDDIYTQILATLSRCVQSLLVPKKAKGHDGSGDVMSIDPLTVLDKLLLEDAPRSQYVTPKDKLLVLLADSLSVVFATIDELTPGPVSSSYIDDVVAEERADAARTQCEFAKSSASGIITSHTESTDSRPDTVSASSSSVQQQFAPPVKNTAATNFGTQSTNLPNQQEDTAGMGAQTGGFGSEISITTQHQNGFSGQSANRSPAPSFGSGSQDASAQPTRGPSPQGSNYSQQSRPMFGTLPRNRAPMPPPAPPVVGISFGTQSKNLPSPVKQSNQPAAPSFGAQQQAAPQQQFQQSAAPQQQTQQSTPAFGTQSVTPQQFQQQPAPQQQQFQQSAVPSFGTQQQPVAAQQSAAPQQQQFQQPAAPSFGTQPNNLQQQQNFQSAPSQAQNVPSASVTPQTDSSQLNTVSSNVTSSRMETDGRSGASGDNGMYTLPVKKPMEMPELGDELRPGEPDIKLYDWKDYNPGPSNWAQHDLPPQRGGGYGDRGGRRGGFSGGRGGFGGDRGGARGGRGGGRGGSGFGAGRGGF